MRWMLQNGLNGSRIHTKISGSTKHAGTTTGTVSLDVTKHTRQLHTCATLRWFHMYS